MKNKQIVAVVLIALMLGGCASTDQIADDFVDYAYELAQDNDVYVETIKSTKMPGYSCTYNQAFSNFFAYPKWKHFTSDTGDEVVEFTGECEYDGQQVKALIQFTITNEYDNYIEWEASYLSFNNVSQNILMLGALLEKTAEEYQS